MTPSRSGHLRADFPVLARRLDGQPIVYLDSAATSLKPQAVIDAVVEYYGTIGANIHRGKHALSEEASARFERARTRLGQLCGLPSTQLVFTPSTTHAINLVADGLRLAQDDLVLCTEDAHHGNLLPWRTRARVEVIRVDDAGVLDLDHLAGLLRQRPRVVALTACSNVTGIYAPVDALVRLAHASGAQVLIDAAQAVPHGRFGLMGTGADFVVFSGHKMLAPGGIGVLAGRLDALEGLAPTLVGGGTVDWVDPGEIRWRKLPHRLEAGTPDVGAVFGLDAAVGYLEAIGAPALEAHDQHLARVLLDEVAARPWLTLIGGHAAPRAGLVSFAVKGVARLDEVARMLSDGYGVMARSGHLCAQPLVDRFTDGEVLRLSTYLYSTEEEVRGAFAALDELRTSLGL